MLDKLFDIDVLKFLGPIGVICLFLMWLLVKLLHEMFKMWRQDMNESKQQAINMNNQYAKVIEGNTAESARTNQMLETIRNDQLRAGGRP